LTQAVQSADESTVQQTSVAVNTFISQTPELGLQLETENSKSERALCTGIGGAAVGMMICLGFLVVMALAVSARKARSRNSRGMAKVVEF